MASRVAAAVRRASVCALVGTIMAGCKGAYQTPAPPLLAGTSITDTTNAGLRAYCKDSGLTFDSTAAKDTTVDSTHVTIVPEKGSAFLHDSDIVQGRIIALIKVTSGSFPEVGASRPGSLCWFARGAFPDSVVSTFIPRSSDSLSDSLHRFYTRTHPERPPHARAEVKWKSPADTIAQRSALPVRLASLLPAAPPIRALAWSTCTGGYCCSPSSGHN